MSGALLIDRHAFASNASSFDTAWQTFGWSPALEGARASRLEEQVPWATLAARAETPARLSGLRDAVLAPANFDNLQWGFLPLDGRHGFAVWGAIGERRNGEWRVLTHTLLFDDTAFDVMAGFPQGLMTVPAVAAWFAEMVDATFAAPALLSPIRLERTRATRRAFEDARRAEVARLRARLLDLLGGVDRLEAELGALLEALARVRGGGAVRHVALRSTADRRSELLVRLAWTSLPLADRVETSFLTEQRRTEAPRVTILVLPESEWGQYVPQATQLLDIGRAKDDVATRGRRQWARSIARGAHHRDLSARVESRRWRVVARDDLSAVDAYSQWRDRWLDGTDRGALARELLALEVGGETGAGGRTRAAAHIAALAFAPHSAAAGALLDAFRVHPSAATGLIRAAIRTLMRGGGAARVQALLLRCHAALEPHLVPPTELFRLFEREAPLVAEAAAHPAAARALFRAAFAAGCSGHAAADRLITAALAGLDAPAQEIATAIAQRDPADPRVTRVLAQCVHHVLRLHGDVSGLSAALLEALRGRAVPAGLVEPLLRLLWLERRIKGRTAAADFACAAGADAWPVLVPLLVAPAPLPLFLELRRVLAEMPARPRAAAIAPWLPALEEYSPSLHERLRADVTLTPA